MSKRTLIAIGDQHFSDGRLADCKIVANEVLDIVDKEKPDGVVLLGDLLHTHSSTKMASYNLAIQWIRDLSTKSHVYVLVGNHERPNNNTPPGPDHFFNALKFWENVTIVDEPMMKTISDLKCVFMPYVPMGTYHEEMERYFGDQKNSGDIYFSHQGFRGAKYDNGMVSTDSDVWAQTLPLNICGHYHRAQQPFDNLIYAGSLMQTCHGEAGQEKRLLRIELDSNTQKIITTDIPLKNQPQFETITIDITDPPEIAKNPKNRYVLTGGTTAELLSFHILNQKTLGKNVQFQPIGIKEISIPTVEKIDPIAELKKLIEEDEDEMELLKHYLSNQKGIEMESSIQLPPPKRKLKLIIGHFMSLEDREFSLEPGITRLIGENGSGKSTLLNSIQWLLFGGNTPSEAQSVQSSKPIKKEKTSVTLEARKQWTITRSTNPRSLVLVLGKETYKDESAQGIIDASFGKKEIWEVASRLGQRERCAFFTASDKEKKEILSLVFSENASMIELGRQLTEDEGKYKKEKDLALRSLQEFEKTIGDFMEAPKKPDLSDLIQPEEPDLSDLIESEEPTFAKLKIPTEPDNSDLKFPKKPERNNQFSIDECEKELKRISKSLAKGAVIAEKKAIQKINEEKITELKKKLSPKKELDQIKEILKIKEKIVPGNSIEPILPADINECRKQWEAYSELDRYRKEFKREPNLERLQELKDGVAVECPECRTGLLFDSKQIKLEKRPEKWVHSSTNDKERKMLLSLNFSATKPNSSVEDLEEKLRQYQLQEKLKTFDPILIENAKTILAENTKISKEIDHLERLNEEELENINIEALEKEQTKYGRMKTELLDKETFFNTQMVEWEQKKKELELEKAKRMAQYDEEVRKYEWEKKTQEKIIAEWKKEKNRIEEEKNRRRVRWESEKTRIAKEKERRLGEWKKNKEKWKKVQEKVTALEEEKDELFSSWVRVRNLLQKFKKLQAQIFERRLELWNFMFDSILKKCLDDIEGKIVPFRETKTATIEKIGLDIVFEGKRRTTLKDFSFGEADIVSLAFLLAILSLLPSPFKIVTMDEVTSQISKKRTEEKITGVLEEYLEIKGCFALISSHDHELLLEHPEIELLKNEV